MTATMTAPKTRKKFGYVNLTRATKGEVLAFQIEEQGVPNGDISLDLDTGERALTVEMTRKAAEAVVIALQSALDRAGRTYGAAWGKKSPKNWK